MEVAVLKADDDFDVECGCIHCNVKVADLNETCPEVLSKVGNGNCYIRLE
jgi:hypothetical protein